jgi:hypothetical protein
VKYWITALTIFALLSASLALAEDFKTVKGKEYKNATVRRVEPDGIVLLSKSGVVKVYFAELPKEIQKRFGYDAVKAGIEKNCLEEKRIQEQKAAERQRLDRENRAEADLKQAEEEFQAAERRAGKADQSAAKGSLSGQVFVSTKGGENFKLGAVRVALFAREAIDVLLAGVKTYGDIKIQQLRPSVDAAKAAYEQTDAAERSASAANTKALGSPDFDSTLRTWNEAIEAARHAREQYFKIRPELDYYYSGGFYFGFLQSPLQTAETDAEGKFLIEVPQTGDFVMAAHARRAVGEHTEQYYWLQPVSLEGKQQRVQNLSNNNLTSTTGTSALVITQD